MKLHQFWKSTLMSFWLVTTTVREMDHLVKWDCQITMLKKEPMHGRIIVHNNMQIRHFRPLRTSICFCVCCSCSDRCWLSRRSSASVLGRVPFCACSRVTVSLLRSSSRRSDSEDADLSGELSDSHSFSRACWRAQNGQERGAGQIQIKLFHKCITYNIMCVQMLGRFSATSDLLLVQMYNSGRLRRS